MPDARLSDRRRVAALREMGLLTDTREEAYDRFARRAAPIVAAPIPLFTVITEEEQFFRSQVGLPEPIATTRRTPLSHSFCQYVILSSAPLEVTDAREHPVVKGNPAIEEMQVIAYLGVPLITRRGETLGSLCAIDHEPREWTSRDRAVLKDLASATVTEVELRRTTREAVELAGRLEGGLRELRKTRRCPPSSRPRSCARSWRSWPSAASARGSAAGKSGSPASTTRAS